MKELTKYIKANGLNQAEFARLVGISESALCRWLKGERVPQYPALKRLAAVTGVSVEKIARGFE